MQKQSTNGSVRYSGKQTSPIEDRDKARLHDLRHAFSVHSFVAMAESGLDLYYSLPLLSEYLGHQSLEATDKYVRLTSDMYPKLLSNVNTICSYAFPEVKVHEAD